MRMAWRSWEGCLAKELRVAAGIYGACRGRCVARRCLLARRTAENVELRIFDAEGEDLGKQRAYGLRRIGGQSEK